MVSFLKISGLLLLVNVHGENTRRYLKNKLLGQKVNRHREYKQLVAGATYLSLDDLEKMAIKPERLFNNEHDSNEHDSLTMSLDDLEKISNSVEKLQSSWENSFVAQNPTIGWGVSFLTNEDNIKGDTRKWDDLMNTKGDMEEKKGDGSNWDDIMKLPPKTKGRRKQIKK
jgi:hypothetical protein